MIPRPITAPVWRFDAVGTLTRRLRREATDAREAALAPVVAWKVWHEQAGRDLARQAVRLDVAQAELRRRMASGDAIYAYAGASA